MDQIRPRKKPFTYCAQCYEIVFLMLDMWITRAVVYINGGEFQYLYEAHEMPFFCFFYFHIRTLFKWCVTEIACIIQEICVRFWREREKQSLFIVCQWISMRFVYFQFANEQQQYKIFELWFNEMIWLQVNSQNIVAFSVKIRDWWAIIELNGMVEISTESQPFKWIFQPGPFDGLFMIISIVILKLKRNESQPPNVKTRYRDINGIDMKLSVSDFVAWWSAYELKQQSQA